MNRLILHRLILLFLLLPSLLFAQIIEPVKWKFQSEEVNNRINNQTKDSKTESQYGNKANAQLVVKYIASIDKGWHIYDQNLPSDGPSSTQFVVDKATNIEPLGPAVAVLPVVEQFEEMFQMKLRWYESNAVFVQKFKIIDPSKPYSIEGHVSYMACNNVSCLPPTEMSFSFEKNPQKPKQEASVVKDDDKHGQMKRQGNSPTEKNGGTVAPFSFTEMSDDMSHGNSSNTLAQTTDENDENDKKDKTSNPSFINSPIIVNDSSLNTTFCANEPATWQPVIAEMHARGESTEGTTGSLWSIFLVGLIGGLVALLTPCVWPIIPMTVSFFLHKKDGSGKRSALFYGASIIVIYVGLGVLLTLLFGADVLNALSTNAIFNLFLFALLILFAISFFGGFDLALPASWSTAMEEKADNTTGIISILLMATTLVVVSFSCTGPIIGTLLVHIATKNNFIAPIIGMSGFAFALSVPFTFFALFPNIMKKMPKSGSWMNTVKVLLGFFELAFALKFFSVADLAYGWHLMDREVFLSLWIAICALTGLYLIGKIRFYEEEKNLVTVPRLIGALATFSFALYLLPGLWGAPLKAVSAFAPPMWTQDFNLYDETQSAFTDYDEATEQSKKTGKPILIDFSGYGCVNCRKMESTVWNDPKVKSLMEEKFILVSLFVDDKTHLDSTIIVNENGEEKTLKTVGEKWSYLQRHKFGANAQPFYVVVDANGQPLSPSYAFSEDVSAFSDFLQRALNNH